MRTIWFVVSVLIVTSSSVAVAAAHTLNPAVIEKITGEDISEVHDGHEPMEADPRYESRTYYSFPEWYIVYSAQEYGRFVEQGNRPSQYPYGKSIAQMWHAWGQVEQLAGEAPDPTTLTVLWTIALSYSVESAIIGLYENTIGWLSEWLHLGYKTVEDRYIDEQAVRYGKFLNQTPWYEFPYYATLGGLWKTYSWSSISPRGIERRIAYSFGYGVKGVYAGIIRYLSHASFEGGAGQVTAATVIADQSQLHVLTASSTPIQGREGVHRIEFPRYRAFREPAVIFALAGGNFEQIAGNATIAVSVLVPVPSTCSILAETKGFSLPLVSQPNEVRQVLVTPVAELGALIRNIVDCGLVVEHIYDY